MEKTMRSRKLSLVVWGFALLLFCLSNAAEAHISVGLSIGTSFGHRYPGYGYGYGPYHPWPGGYYSWLDRDYYSWWDAGWYSPFPRRHYWPGRSHSSVGIWIGSYHPMGVGAPVMIDRNSVGSARSKAIDPAKNPTADAYLSEAMRKLKSEQLKILKIGDKEQRIQAIRELAPFSFDNEIRLALEKVLLTDPDPQLRQEVAVLFGKTENQLVLAALTEAKEKDHVREVRQAAYRSIIMIKGY